jgi:hypothetical protein
MAARIFKPARTAMQSGRANTKDWVLVYEPESPRQPEPLMGYTSSSDMLSQVRLSFDTQEAAEAYAKRHGIAYRVQKPHEPTVQRNAYSDNFRVDRKVPWSH